MEWEVKRILVLVKTYPSPSKKYQEVVCTAGITDAGEMIRIYPVNFRYLDDDQKFEKYRWIEARVKRNPQDQRRESYKIDYDSIKLLDRIDSKQTAERLRWILPHVSISIDDIIEKHATEKRTLGIFKPRSVIRLEMKKLPTSDWTDEELTILNQTTLEDKQVKPLEKIPYDFYFHFVCDDPECQTEHRIKITDWELYQAFRRFCRNYGGVENGFRVLEEKYIKMFSNPNTNTYFLAGTVHQMDRFGTFILIGVTDINNASLIYPQMSLF